MAKPKTVGTCPACGYEMYDGGIMTTNPAGRDQIACRDCAGAWEDDTGEKSGGSVNE